MSPYEPRFNKLAVSLPPIPGRVCYEFRDAENALEHYGLPLYHLTEPGTVFPCDKRSFTLWNNRVDEKNSSGSKRYLKSLGECNYTTGGKSQSGGYKSTYLMRFICICSVVLGLSWVASTASCVHRGLKSLKCINVTPANCTDGLVLNVPYLASKHILVHDSLTGGDIFVTHSSGIEHGTLQFAVAFKNASSHHEIYDGCVADFRRGTGVGIIPHDDHTKRADIATFLIRIPQSTSSPSIKFFGEADAHISDKTIRKIIRWWRKHHHSSH